jgi:putative ABC transport system permease protein
VSTPWILVRRHLVTHWVRTLLTGSGMVVALYLYCLLSSLVTTLHAVVDQAASNRLVTQSAVSLFVQLPLDYQPKIDNVPGVEASSKFQWFGGVYQDPDDFLAQFGVDHEIFFDMYRKELEIVEGPGGVTGPAAREAVLDALAAERRGIVIGTGLVREYGWKVGDTVPLLGTIWTHSDGSAWEFLVVGIYSPLKSNVDDRTTWFRYDYLKESIQGGGVHGPPISSGVYMVNVADGHDVAQVIADIDALFANGPQVTRTTTEAAFQATFVAMMGNVPLFVGTIGGAVAFAVFFSVINTMLMSARQRTHETGILKALGFRDAALGRLMLGESLALSLLGGGLGVGLALATQEPLRQMLGKWWPQYAVAAETAWAGLSISLAIGIVAGVAPAILAARTRPCDALRSEG